MRTLFTCAVLPALIAPMALAAEEPAERVFRVVGPSVVSLRNPEGSGTGVVLSTNGLILTNAHVIMSPLPFEAQVDVAAGGTTKPQTFRNVTILGVHPKYDLALVKIEPKEHPGRLTPAQLMPAAARTGQQVYAIGNPATGGNVILTKTITAGMLSSADRVLESLPYYQFSAAINPGNSGGPLCDKDGKVLGIVTLKATDVEGIGFAIPVTGFNPKIFVPMSERMANKEEAKELYSAALKYMDQADLIQRRLGRDDPRVQMLRGTALRLCWHALMNSPKDDGLYYSVGMLYRTLDEPEKAVPYLVRAIELNPWGDEVGIQFRELGLALVKQKRVDEAVTAWQEGLAKHPGKAGIIWEDMAVTHMNAQRFADAAYSAQAAVQTGKCRLQFCQGVIRDASGKLAADDNTKLQKRLRDLPADLQKTQAAADKALAAKKKYLTPAFEAWMKKSAAPEVQTKTTIEQLWGSKSENTAAAAPADGQAKPADPAASPQPVADAKANWIAGKMELAKLYKKSNLIPKAIEVLKEIIETHPDHPDTKKAQQMLEHLQ